MPNAPRKAFFWDNFSRETHGRRNEITPRNEGEGRLRAPQGQYELPAQTQVNE